MHPKKKVKPGDPLGGFAVSEVDVNQPGVFYVDESETVEKGHTLDEAAKRIAGQHTNLAVQPEGNRLRVVDSDVNPGEWNRLINAGGVFRNEQVGQEHLPVKEQEDAGFYQPFAQEKKKPEPPGLRIDVTKGLNTVSKTVPFPSFDGESSDAKKSEPPGLRIDVTKGLNTVSKVVPFSALGVESSKAEEEDIAPQGTFGQPIASGTGQESVIKPRLTGEGDEDIPPPGPLMASAAPGFMPGASSGTDKAQPPMIYGTDPEKKPDKPTFNGDIFYADHIRKELKEVPYGREMEWLRIQLKNAETDMQKKAVLDVAYEFQEQAYRQRPITQPGAYFGDPSDPKLRERLQKRYEEGKMWRTPEKYPDEFLSAIEHYFDPFPKPNPLHDPVAVAKATGLKESDVREALPLIISALEEQGILNDNTLIGALATVGVESRFKPVEEAYDVGSKAREKYFKDKPYARVDADTHKRYFGRGYIQLTGRNNYERYGKDLDIDLINNPELAYNPKTAAKVFALYFKTNGVDQACNGKNWRAVRFKVNRGYNGWNEFSKYVTNLEKLRPLDGK